MSDHRQPTTSADEVRAAVYEFAADLAWQLNSLVWIARANGETLQLVVVPDLYELEAKANRWKDLPPTTMIVRSDGRSAKLFRSPIGMGPADLAEGSNILLLPEGVRL